MRLTKSSFFFNDTATTEIYTLSLHDALPIWALSGAAIGLLAASKQYAVLFVVPLALSMPRRRGLWVAAAVLIAVLAPFAIDDPAGFWRSVVRFQLVQPFRFDSLSLEPFAARLIGPAVQPFALAGLALGAGVLAFSLR